MYKEDEEWDRKFYNNVEKNLNLSTEEGRKGFSKIKGHELINSIIIIMLIIFLFDFFGNDKKFIGNIIEVLKTLLFTLSGYLFGKSEKE